MKNADICPYCGIGRDAYTSSVPWRQHLAGHAARHDPKRYDGNVTVLSDLQRASLYELHSATARMLESIEGDSIEEQDEARQYLYDTHETYRSLFAELLADMSVVALAERRRSS